MLREAPDHCGSRPLYPEVLAANAASESPSGGPAPHAKKAKRIAAFVTLAALGLGLAACFSGEAHTEVKQNPPANTGPGSTPPSVAVDIDTSQALTTTPGDGVGIFVEYDGNGVWKLWTSCDTNKSAASCGFDLYATADKLQVQSLDKLEDSDFVDLNGNTAHVSFDTSTDTDGVTFTTSPGTPFDLEVYLDAASAQEFVYWVGDGKVNSGAPANPIEFTPH